jgi:cell division protein FtsN
MVAIAAIMVVILAAIFNMVAKTQQISKCSNAPITKKIDI